MVEMIIKRNKFLLFFLILFGTIISGCKKKTVTYFISQTYSGPCIIFIYPTNNLKEQEYVYLKNGLSRVNKNLQTNIFIFRSLENNNEVKLIEIGSTEKADLNKKYIFKLVKGETSSNCGKKDIEMISFFYGYKKEFLRWNKVYHGEFDYFDEKHIDWCSYYKEGCSSH